MNALVWEKRLQDPETLVSGIFGCIEIAHHRVVAIVMMFGPSSMGINFLACHSLYVKTELVPITGGMSNLRYGTLGWRTSNPSPSAFRHSLRFFGFQNNDHPSWAPHRHLPWSQVVW